MQAKNKTSSKTWYDRISPEAKKVFARARKVKTVQEYIDILLHDVRELPEIDVKAHVDHSLVLNVVDERKLRDLSRFIDDSAASDDEDFRLIPHMYAELYTLADEVGHASPVTEKVMLNLKKLSAEERNNTEKVRAVLVAALKP